MSGLNSEKWSTSPAWLEPILVSSIRCHLLGGALSLICLLGIAWMWVNADAFARDDRYAPKQIEEAIHLIADADNLGNKYASQVRLWEQNERRRAAIQGWLPRSIDWETTSQRIDEIAKDAQVQLMSIDKGEQQAGQRIGIQQVTCEIHGSYVGLCRFLDQLCRDPRPMWCDSVRIQRAPPDLDEPFECAASISLRVPLAAEGTIAAKLLQSEDPDAT